MALLISDRNSKLDPVSQDINGTIKNCDTPWSLYISTLNRLYTHRETANTFYVRRLADGGQEKGSRERTAMLPEGYHKRYTKQISGYEPIRAVGTPINPMKA